jgi:hypothetical protein
VSGASGQAKSNPGGIQNPITWTRDGAAFFVCGGCHDGGKKDAENEERFILSPFSWAGGETDFQQNEETERNRREKEIKKGGQYFSEIKPWRDSKSYHSERVRVLPFFVWM